MIITIIILIRKYIKLKIELEEQQIRYVNKINKLELKIKKQKYNIRKLNKKLKNID